MLLELLSRNSITNILRNVQLTIKVIAETSLGILFRAKQNLGKCFLHFTPINLLTHNFSAFSLKYPFPVSFRYFINHLMELGKFLELNCSSIFKPTKSSENQWLWTVGWFTTPMIDYKKCFISGWVALSFYILL